MTITKLCEMLKSELLNNGYEYGFIAEGKKYKPDMSNGFDKEYYQHSLTIYRVQDPLVTMKEKIGTCVDAVLVMKHILDVHGIFGKIWLLYNKGKNKVHTVLTFEAESKVVYLELTPQSGKACYGKELVYEDEQMFLQELEKQNYEVSDVTEVSIDNFLWLDGRNVRKRRILRMYASSLSINSSFRVIRRYKKERVWVQNV